MLNMITKYINDVKRVCENFQEVENYDLAMADDSQCWELHHRRETHNLETGEIIKGGVGRKQLIAMGLYYHRPPEELIFLTRSEHNKVHGLCRKGIKKGPRSDEWKKHISEGLKGKPKSESHKKKLSISRMGIKLSDEARKNISEGHKGLTPWNKGKSGYKIKKSVKIQITVMEG